MLLFLQKKILLYQYEVLIFLISLTYTLFWLKFTPMQFSGDSDGYLAIAYMLSGQNISGMPPIFRTPGYPLLILISGGVIPGTFLGLLFLQVVFAAIIPVLIYRILLPEGKRIATICAIFTILTGITTIHASQIMSEQFFITLLFTGLLVATSLLRIQNVKKINFFLLALIFALMNMVRPIAWPMFWIILLMILWNFKRNGLLNHYLKSTSLSALLFACLMTVWTIADDVFLSAGARYSALIPSGSSLNYYQKIIPFNEAYFEPWQHRIRGEINDPYSRNISDAKSKIKEELIKDIRSNKSELMTNSSIYPFSLFGRYASNPERLADRIFNWPNYSYAGYLNTALDRQIGSENRQSLFSKVAEESGRNWPIRWVKLIKNNPLFFIMGPSHGGGISRFLIAYSSLRNYLPNPEKNSYRSLVNPYNGPATRLLFSILIEALQEQPNLWLDDSFFGPYVNEPEELIEFIIANPNQTSHWSITSLLWGLMGYDSASDLLGKVADETFSQNIQPLILRTWDSLIKVIAGPGFVDIDNTGPRFGRVEIYSNVSSLQLTKDQEQELRTSERLGNNSISSFDFAVIVKFLYFLFYLLKPIFFITSIIAISIVWSKNKNITPLILMTPYIVSSGIYGIFVTAWPRYTDPVLILPFLVTVFAFPYFYKIYYEHKF